MDTLVCRGRTVTTHSATDDPLPRRLPLPLAQLYRRAQNAKTPLERHLTAFYLWEAALKLLSASAVVGYARAGAPDPTLNERLKNLARPALGHWWEFVRLLVPWLADHDHDAFRRTRDLLLGRPRDDLPRAAGLDAVLRDELDGRPGSRSVVRPAELFDRLVRYRNKYPGHGAVGRLPDATHRRLGGALLAGLGELLDRLDVTPGRRLMYVGEVRQAGGVWVAERFELVGESARRSGPLELPRDQAARLPDGDRVYLADPADDGPDGLTPLHPLVVYDPDADETLFLNARRGKARAEYLCYTTGKVTDRDDLDGARLALLGGVLGVPVGPVQAAAWAADSLAGEPPPDPPAGSTAPARLLGEFELLSELGRGGMGVVYRAWQPSLGRQVALKKLQRAGDPRAEARFAREIKALGRVEHPHLVKVFTSGSDGDQWFYAMELVEGADLAAVCTELAGSTAAEVSEDDWTAAVSTAHDHARQGEKTLGPGPAPVPPAPPAAPAPPEPRAAGKAHVARVVELVAQVAGAAHALHEAGVVHRDIKPGNILLTAGGGHAVLMDLGLAQLMDETEGRLTRTRQFVGTLRYASPEQLVAARLDPRADVYSLGATLWELLTLRPLFGATDQTPTPELMLKIQSADPGRVRAHNRRVPADLEAVVLRCLEKDRARRYPSAAELAADLRRWLRGEPVLAQPPSLRYLLGKQLRKNRGRLAAAVGVAVALAAVVVAALSTAAVRRIDRARQDAEDARAAVDRSLEDARAARQSEADQRRLADARAEQVRAQAARLGVLTGDKLYDDGDPPGALGWYANALATDAGDPDREWPHRVRLATLYQQCPKLVRLWRHDGVRLAAFGPDERRAVSCGADGLVRVWEVGEDRPVGELPHPGAVHRLAFHPAGRWLATACEDGCSRVWDLDTRRAVADLRHDAGAVRWAEFSPDGALLVTAGDDRTARVWRTATWAAVGPPRKHPGEVLCAALSPDGTRLVTGGKDKAARVWTVDGTEGEPLTLSHTDEVNWVGFSPDGSRVLTAGTDRRVVWELSTGKELDSLRLAHYWKGVGVVVGPDGRRCAAADRNRTLVWTPGAKNPLALPHGRPSEEITAVAFGPDGLSVATAGTDGTARVWDAATGMQLTAPLAHQGPVRAVAVGRSGCRVLTAAADGFVRVWEVVPGDVPAARFAVGKVSSARLSPDGRRAVTVRRDGTLLWAARLVSETSSSGSMTVDRGEAQLWDIGGGRLITTLAHPGEDRRVLAATFTPDGRQVLTAGADGTVRNWDAETGAGRAVVPLRNPWLRGSIQFLENPTRLATFDDGEVRVWDPVTGQPLDNRLGGQALDSKHARNRDLAPGMYRVRRETGHDLGPLLDREPGIRCLAVSPDGRRVATGTADGTARVWDAATREPITPPLKHPGPVDYVAFSPDGRYIVCSDGIERVEREVEVARKPTGMARVWDAATGDPVTPPLFHDRHVVWSDFTPDGRRVVTLSEDGFARVWDLPADARPPREWAELAEVVSGRRVRPTGGSVALRPDEVQARWDECRQHRPADFETPPDRVRTWHAGEADRQERAKEWFAAAWHLGRLIEAAPRDPALFARRAAAWEQLGDRDRAIRDYSAMIALTPGDWQAVLARGRLSAETKAFAPAEDDFSKALLLCPADQRAAVLVRRAAARLELGRYAGFEADARAAEPGLPRDGRPAAELARLRRRLARVVLDTFGKFSRPDRPPFAVRLEPDRADRSYRDGEAINLTVTSDRAGYLYVFRCDPDGRVACVYPGRGQPDHRIPADRPVRVPADGAPLILRVAALPGRHLFTAVVTPEPLRGVPADDLLKQPETVFGTGQAALDRLAALDGELRARAADWSSGALDVFGGGRTVGVFVGINTYPGLGPGHEQRYCRNDAEELAQVLRDRYGVEPILLLDEKATLAEVERVLRQDLPRRTRPGDTVVLFWAGHSIVGPDYSLVPHDARRPDKDKKPDRVVTGGMLAGWLAALEGRRVLAVFDVSYAAGIAQAIRQPGVTSLAGCEEAEAGFEVHEFGHGAFTHFLLQYLRQGEPPLDLTDAYTFTRDGIKAGAADKGRDAQTPVLVLPPADNEAPPPRPSGPLMER